MSQPTDQDPVRSFYEQLPFNRHGDVRDAVAAVKAHTLEHTYPDLHALLKTGRVRRVFEAGCGAGWLTATMALHYGVEVTAVDFCTASLDCARQLAKALRIERRVQFVERDLFEHQGAVVDLVVSIGVLHHTRDCAAAFRHVARFAAPWLYVGLYHQPGRRPFLDMFERLVAQRGEQAAFERYRQLDGVHAGDETMLRSWFRDQVLHPRETQHTLREVCGWLDAGGFALRSTSVNRFAALPDREQLFALEPTFAERSRQANEVEGRYFPGFFTVLAKRTDCSGVRE